MRALSASLVGKVPEEMNRETPTCDLCGHTHFSLVYNLGHYHILRCDACRLVYRFPMPDAEELYRMYNVDRHVPDEDLKLYYHDFRDQTYRNMLSAFSQLQPDAASLLICDVGGGLGWSHAAIKANGHQPITVDINLDDCKIARKTAPAVQSLSECLPFQSESLDAIMLCDVLEHVTQPRSVLSEMHRVLKADGYLLIRVPNTEGLLIRAMDSLYKLSLGHFKKPGRRLYSVHLYGFNPTTLARYLREQQFEIQAAYGESSKNIKGLKYKPWAKNPLVRIGVTWLTWLGSWLNREDEWVVIAQKVS